MWRPAIAWQISCKPDVTGAERRVAHQVLKRPQGIVIDKPAIGVEIHGRGRRKLSAVNAGGSQPGFYLGRIGSAFHMHFATHVAAPAGIGTGSAAGKLAKLGVTPLQVEMD